MPAIYAHDTFGKLVSKQLPKEIQDIIKTYQNEKRREEMLESLKKSVSSYGKTCSKRRIM